MRPPSSSPLHRSALCPAAAPVRGRDQPELPGPRHRIGATVCAELGVDVAQMCSDRVRRDEQLGSNLRCPKVAGQVTDYTQLGVAEFIDQSCGRSALSRRRAGDYIEDCLQERGVRGAVAREVLEQFPCGNKDEGQDESLRFGDLKGTFKRPLRSAWIPGLIPGNRLEEQRFGYRGWTMNRADGRLEYRGKRVGGLPGLVLREMNVGSCQAQFRCVAIFFGGRR